MTRLSFLRIVAILMFLSTSCSKEDDFAANENLVGVWYQENESNETDRTYTTEWSFGEDGILEIVSKESVVSTKEFLGYTSLSKGRNTFDNSILDAENMVGYSYQFDGETYFDDADYYSDKESFFKRKGIAQKFNKASISFSNRNQELLMTLLECNDTGDCIGSLTLTRKKSK